MMDIGKLRVGLLVLATFLSLSTFAADNFDVTGTWSGNVRLDNGTELPFIAVLEQNGTRVTGVLEGIGGAPDVEIMNGRIENDTVRFSGVRVIQDQNVAFDYIGTYTGEFINFTIVRVGATGPNSVLNTLTSRQP